MYTNIKIIIPVITVVALLVAATITLGILYGLKLRKTDRSEGIWTSMLNPATYSEVALKKLLNEGGYVLISAGRNRKMSADMNLTEEIIQQRQINLTLDLTYSYIYSPMFGIYNGDNETSFFVILHNILPNAERNSFIQLGRKYNQESIIYVRKATPTIQEFIYTTGEFSGKYVQGQGYEFLFANVTDDYSAVNICSSDIIKFTLHFDFGTVIEGKIRTQTQLLIDHHKNYILENKRKQNP